MSDPNKNSLISCDISMVDISISRGLGENSYYIASNRRKEANERERKRSWVIYRQKYRHVCLCL